MSDDIRTRRYHRQITLKYGANPHQGDAAVYSVEDSPLPFSVVHGTPGYINLLDALNAWQLVRELRRALDLPAAASFKHVSPAGAAVATPLSPVLREVYEQGDRELSPSALAYLRARQADPMSSFGDFAALSDPVDADTANVLRTEVSDGLIAPAYSDEALEILKAKKGGKFIILQADPTQEPPPVEYRELHGVAFSQQRNATVMGPEHLQNVVTQRTDLPEAARRDLLLAAITVKYTQSNSVGYALDGQMIGVGAGQQSRVDCTKLAGRKAATWYLRQHPKVLKLPFREGVRRAERVNARVRYIEGDFTAKEHAAWTQHFSSIPEPLTHEEKAEWLATLSGVALASDAFFPFRDSIDQAAARGVGYVIQPGGSIADEEITRACDEYGMVMAFSGVRLFHH